MSEKSEKKQASIEKSTRKRKPKQKSPIESEIESEADGHETFIVEKILDKKKEHGVWKYKVKWQDYGEEECTWEPAKNLEKVKNLIAEFNKTWRKEEGSDDKEDEKSSREKSSREKTTSDRKKSTASKSPVKKIKTEKDLAFKKDLPAANYGHFEFGDVPEKVAKVVKDGDTIVFTIKWLPRKNGTIPPQTQMTNLELRKYNKDLLIDFYEKRLKFKGPSESKSVTKDSVQKDAQNDEIVNKKDYHESEQRGETIQEEKEGFESNIENEEVNENENGKKNKEKENKIQVEDHFEHKKSPIEILSEGGNENKDTKMEIEEFEQKEAKQEKEDEKNKVEIEEEPKNLSSEESNNVENKENQKTIETTLVVPTLETGSGANELIIESPKEISDNHSQNEIGSFE